MGCRVRAAAARRGCPTPDCGEAVEGQYATCFFPGKGSKSSPRRPRLELRTLPREAFERPLPREQSRRTVQAPPGCLPGLRRQSFLGWRYPTRAKRHEARALAFNNHRQSPNHPRFPLDIKIQLFCRGSPPGLPRLGPGIGLIAFSLASIPMKRGSPGTACPGTGRGGQTGPSRTRARGLARRAAQAPARPDQGKPKPRAIRSRCHFVSPSVNSQALARLRYRCRSCSHVKPSPPCN